MQTVDVFLPDRLQTFAASVAHDLRTPLAVLAGEVEIALRRDRSTAAYRETLVRIAAGVKQLVDLSGDLAFLGDEARFGTVCSGHARLDVAFAHLAGRYAAAAPTDLTFDVSAPNVIVRGDQKLLTRALILLVDHAIHFRSSRSPICLHLVSRAAAHGEDDISIVLDAEAPGFSPDEWRHLTSEALDEPGIQAPGLLTLQTAARIVQQCSGAVHVDVVDGRASVHVRLRSVPIT